jgi:hypothetical protein
VLATVSVTVLRSALSSISPFWMKSSPGIMGYLICFHNVMAELVPAIHASQSRSKRVDALVKPEHDGGDGRAQIT